MAIKIAVSNQKGGVAKTTTAINIADVLTHCGYKVLLIDLDPQCNATDSYSAIVEGEYTLYDVFEENCSLREAIQKTKIGDIVPGDKLLNEIKAKIQTSFGGYNRINLELQGLEDEYDYVIMDTAPDLGVFLLSALAAADGCVIPVTADKYAIDGLSLLIDTIHAAIKNVNRNLKIYGVLFAKYDARNRLDKEMAELLPQVGADIGFKVFDHNVRICQAIKEAQANRLSLIEEAPSCNGAIDYTMVTKELMEVVNG